MKATMNEWLDALLKEEQQVLNLQKYLRTHAKMMMPRCKPKRLALRLRDLDTASPRHRQMPRTRWRNREMSPIRKTTPMKSQICRIPTMRTTAMRKCTEMVKMIETMVMIETSGLGRTRQMTNPAGRSSVCKRLRR